MEILSWLPVKDLVRFKSVSKEWNRLFIDPAFVKLHLRRCSRNTHVLFTFTAKITSEYVVVCPVEDLFDNPSSTLERLHQELFEVNFFYRVVGVCNGLVCSLQHCGPIENKFLEYCFWIFNPATNVVSKDSPRIRVHERRNYEYIWYIYGFGYDEGNDTYQVVFLEDNNESQKQQIKVYYLGDTCWKTMTCDVVHRAMLRVICVSSHINWLAFPKTYSDDPIISFKIKELEIFSYDLKSKTCKYFSMPNSVLEVEPVEYDIEVLKGCLCFTHHHEGNYVVWLKRDFSDEKSWSKLFNIDYQNGPHDLRYNSPSKWEIICMCENDNVVLLANTKPIEFIRYNIRDNTIEDRQPYEDEISSPYYCLFLL